MNDDLRDRVLGLCCLINAGRFVMRMIREGRTIMVQFPNNEERGIEKLALKGKIGRRSKLNGFHWHTLRTRSEVSV